MIIVKLMGGLANQMFQYAAARRLAEKHNAQLRLDVSAYENMAKVDTPRRYQLGSLNVSGIPANQKELSQMLPIDFQANTTYRILRRLGIDKRLRPLGEHSKAFHDIVLAARDNTYLVGWWQNENYFKDIRNILLKEFRPGSLSSKSKVYLKSIQSAPSVSIHVRRGDYVTNKFANAEHGLLPLSYYKKAIDYISKRYPESRYFIFSDDINWCVKNLAIGSDAVYIQSKDYEEIHLMSQCSHNIIANSSFSWWGAWLNDNPDKIVIAPKAWFRNKQSNRESEIVPDRWIRL